jgi:hypothetical protein
VHLPEFPPGLCGTLGAGIKAVFLHDVDHQLSRDFLGPQFALAENPGVPSMGVVGERADELAHVDRLASARRHRPSPDCI